MAIKKRKAQTEANQGFRTEYRKIDQIDGRHPLQDAVPFSYMSYEARRRNEGKVVYFNYNLAKEMGLIDKKHPQKLTTELKKSLVEAFSQIIINEYDVLNDVKIPKRLVKEHRYMATRYLQLQHPDKRGLTSGDGRSLWNGYVEHQGKTWDITSCGTGATCLSPASAIYKKFFQSGDPDISYGCGYAQVEEGFTDVMFSESLYQNGFATERVLCIISYGDSYGVKVRAGLNLVRPSHFFLHLKQGQFERLKALADYYIDRQVSNGTWKPVPRGVNKYDYFLDKMSETFAKISAQFESEYIFCWMDWDGDNILADGGIIDFGSIRQFGLFHHEYRFDDDRWSTNIKEQRQKARDTVHTFAQLVGFLKTGKKKNRKKFTSHKALKAFDRTFAEHKTDLLLRKIGFTENQAEIVKAHGKKTLQTFDRAFRYFEREKSRRGKVKVPDGISWNAIFCMRDMLRELPVLMSDDIDYRLSTKEFIDILKSQYAMRKDLKVNTGRMRYCKKYQDSYATMIKTVAKLTGDTPNDVLKAVTKRSAVINRYERITGDGISAVGEALANQLADLSPQEIQQYIDSFIARQNLNPDAKQPLTLVHSGRKTKVETLVEEAQETIKEYREGL